MFIVIQNKINCKLLLKLVDLIKEEELLLI